MSVLLSKSSPAFREPAEARHCWGGKERKDTLSKVASSVSPFLWLHPVGNTHHPCVIRGHKLEQLFAVTKPYSSLRAWVNCSCFKPDKRRQIEEYTQGHAASPWYQ